MVLASCSTGNGRDTQKNVANSLGHAAPEVFIMAPTEPIGSLLNMDDNDRFIGPNYASNVLYVVAPGDALKLY